MTMRTIGLSQELPDDAKLRARARSFEQEALTALARKQAWRAELQRETALAWLAFRVEVQDLALLAQQRSEAALTTQAAEAVFRSGQGSQTDVFAARSAQARLADMALQTDARLHNARSALRRWIGPADDASPGPLPVIARAPPGMDPVSLRALVADWQALDPELQTAQAREAAARAAADAAREERRADWSVELSFSQRGPRYENMISLGLSVPLRWDPAQRQDRELSARLAQLQQIELETEELRRARGAELERWFTNWRSGLARLAHHDEHLLPLARARAQAAVSSYASGSAPLLPALEARQAELVLHQERLRIEHETAADWSRLATFTSPAEVKP